jgi:hypothetical protein
MVFPYTVQNITQRGPNGSRLQQPSFSYQNVGLNCSITGISCAAMNQTSVGYMMSIDYVPGMLPVEVTVIVGCIL